MKSIQLQQAQIDFNFLRYVSCRTPIEINKNLHILESLNEDLKSIKEKENLLKNDSNPISSSFGMAILGVHKMLLIDNSIKLLKGQKIEQPFQKGGFVSKK